MKKKLLLLLVILVVVVGCRRVPQLADGGQAVVSFYNDALVISADDLYRELVDRFGLEILIDMIDRQILTYKFSEELDNAAETAQQQLEAFKQWFLDDDGEFNEAAMIRQLSQWYSNVDTIEDFLAFLELEHLRSLAILEYAKEQVPERDIEYYYENVLEGDIEASHILIAPNVPANATEEQIEEAEAAARAKAIQLINELNEGADFAELAREHSADEASGNNGGELGWIPQGRMVIEFQRAAWALEVGSFTTTPVQSQFGYHIILKTDEREKPSLESARAGIVEKLAEELVENDPVISINALIELRKSFGFRIEDTRLNSQYSTHISNLLMQARGLQ